MSARARTVQIRIPIHQAPRVTPALLQRQRVDRRVHRLAIASVSLLWLVAIVTSALAVSQ